MGYKGKGHFLLPPHYVSPTSALQAGRYAHRPDQPKGHQLFIVASPLGPVKVLSLLQQVLMATETFLLITNPAEWQGVGRRGEGGNKLILPYHSAIQSLPNYLLDLL